MAERTNIPAFLACGQWETLLADALDGLLDDAQQRAFETHMSICPACAELYNDARRGREWLDFLAPEPEIPAGLLAKLLTNTGPGQSASHALAPELPAAIHAPNVQPIPHWQRPGLMAAIHRFAEPRLMMTAAMAFFSIALTLNLTGVKLNSLRIADLRPEIIRGTMERRITTASTPIIRYYDHLRVVREVGSRVRDLRRATQGEGQPQSEPRRAPEQQNPAAPGESKRNVNPERRLPEFRQPQLSETKESGDSMEVLITLQTRSAQSIGSAKANQERSSVWNA